MVTFHEVFVDLGVGRSIVAYFPAMFQSAMAGLVVVLADYDENVRTNSGNWCLPPNRLPALLFSVDRVA